MSPAKSNVIWFEEEGEESSKAGEGEAVSSLTTLEDVQAVKLLIKIKEKINKCFTAWNLFFISKAFL